MSDVIIYDRMQERRGTAANLASVNEVLREGEPCYETDTTWPGGGRKFKIGDGTTAWNSLAYAVPDVGGGGGGGGYDEGASFPGSPSTNDKYYRTDLNLLCYYDGTRWLTVQEYALAGAVQNIEGGTTNGVRQTLPVRSDYGMYLTRWAVTTYVATTNNGSNYWTIALTRYNATNTGTTVSSFSTGTTPDTASNWVTHGQTINAVLDASAKAMLIIATKTGSAGGMYCPSSVYYRLIVT